MIIADNSIVGWGSIVTKEFNEPNVIIAGIPAKIVKRGINWDRRCINKYLNRYKNARVLLIDDLFKGNITPSDINIIFEIINYRYFNNKPIIVSTEKYKSDLLKIDEAIGSRILEMCDKFNIEVRGKGLNYRIYG